MTLETYLLEKINEANENKKISEHQALGCLRYQDYILANKNLTKADEFKNEEIHFNKELALNASVEFLMSARKYCIPNVIQYELEYNRWVSTEEYNVIKDYSIGMKPQLKLC